MNSPRRRRSVAVALRGIRNAPTILAALERFDDVATAAWRDKPEDSVPLLRDAIQDDSDQLTAIAAVHALAAVPDPVTAPAALLALLNDPLLHLQEHAAWALAAAPVNVLALPRLTDMLCQGGFTGTLAQVTLESWSRTAPAEVRIALRALLAGPCSDDERARLVDTIGLIPGPETEAALAAVVADPREGPAATHAALAALAELQSADAAAQHPTHDGVRDGLTVAQLFLHSDIDRDLLHAGQGDTGGIATLLVHLGNSLLTGDRGVRRVLTISRGPADASLPESVLHLPGHHYLPVPLAGPARNTGNAWPLRVAARRGIANILRTAGPVDVVHLRMADVGSWVAAEVAESLGIPTVLTMAPDPHALIASRSAAHTLTRANFGDADVAEHLVFRVRLLRQLAEQAAHVVVFPRKELKRDLRDLLHLDPETSGRVTVVPEGIDLAPLARAVAEVSAGSSSPALAELEALLAMLPPERRDLPLAITVGRLHPVKGMATLVEAWDAHLRDRCNLLVVGGNLEDPNDDETAQLHHIDAVVERSAAPDRGLLLAGHRPNDTVATWLAVSLLGRPGLAAPHGVYVSASLKEEFGIAILEAMAVGLVVVAPRAGGPATYVDDGATGVLAETRVPRELADAVGRALDLAAAPGAEERAEEARRLVRERFSIDTMAEALAGVYRDVSERHAERLAAEVVADP
ncbi:MAG: glycosyltransferase [Actinomycetota bacterium]